MDEHLLPATKRDDPLHLEAGLARGPAPPSRHRKGALPISAAPSLGQAVHSVPRRDPVEVRKAGGVHRTGDEIRSEREVPQRLPEHLRLHALTATVANRHFRNCWTEGGGHVRGKARHVAPEPLSGTVGRLDVSGRDVGKMCADGGHFSGSAAWHPSQTTRCTHPPPAKEGTHARQVAECHSESICP